MKAVCYERFEIDMDVSYMSVCEALGRAGFTFPRLYVAKENLAYAIEVNRLLGHVMNIEVIPGATDMDEWWVEFGDKCVGSPGA